MGLSFKLNLAKLGEVDGAKTATAQFNMDKIVPETGTLMASIRAGSGLLAGSFGAAF